MGLTAATPTRIFVGAGELFLDGVPIGATQENNMLRILRTYVEIPKFNGAKGPLNGTDYVSTEVPQLEVTLSELVFAQLKLALPGLTSVASAAVAGGASTTLTAGVAIGATVIPVAAATGITAGTFLQLTGSGATGEYVLVQSIAALNVTLAQPLKKAHLSAATVIAWTGRGGTLITSSVQRLATTDYVGVVELLVPGVDANLVSFRVYDAVSVEDFEIEVSDDTNARYGLTFEGRYDPAAPLLAPYTIETLVA